MKWMKWSVRIFTIRSVRPEVAQELIGSTIEAGRMRSGLYA